MQGHARQSLGFTPPPLQLLLSQIVGGLVLAGSLAYKLPQAARIVRAKSAAGVSASAYVIETAGLACSAIYSARSRFPLLTCGEIYSTLTQNVLILALVVLYSDKSQPNRLQLRPMSVGSALAYVAFVAGTFFRGAQGLVSLQLAAIPMINFSRIPQILLIEKRKDTGELAPSTIGLSVAGNAARVFTTVVQLRDAAYLGGILVALAFNAALLSQWWRYKPTKKAQG